MPPALKAGLRAMIAMFPASKLGLENWMLPKPCIFKSDSRLSFMPSVEGILAWTVPFSESAAKTDLQKSSLLTKDAGSTAGLEPSAAAVSREETLLGYSILRSVWACSDKTCTVFSVLSVVEIWPMIILAPVC